MRINRRTQEICLPHIFLTTELNISVGNARKPNKSESQGRLETYRDFPYVPKLKHRLGSRKEKHYALMCLSPNQQLNYTGAADISRKAGQKIERSYQYLYTTMGRQSLPVRSRQVSETNNFLEENEKEPRAAAAYYSQCPVLNTK